MENKEIEEAVADAIEASMIKDALGLSLPPEVIIEGYELIKAFAKFLEATDKTGRTAPVNAMMCLLINMAVYRTDEMMDIERMKRVKTAWIGARDYLIYPQCDGCQNKDT